MQACFLPADILLPDAAADVEKWAVVACDQFTSDRDYWQKAEAAAARLGCMAGDNRDLAAQCQYLFLGVKPQILPGVLEELAPVLRSRKSPCVLVSMAAGVSLARLQSLQALYAAWPDAELIARKEDCTVNNGRLNYTVTYTIVADICG